MRFNSNYTLKQLFYWVTIAGGVFGIGNWLELQYFGRRLGVTFLVLESLVLWGAIFRFIFGRAWTWLGVLFGALGILPFVLATAAIYKR